MIKMALKRNKDNFWRTVYVTKLLKSFNGKHVTGIIKMDNVEYNIDDEWDNIKFEEHCKLLYLLDQI